MLHRTLGRTLAAAAVTISAFFVLRHVVGDRELMRVGREKLVERECDREGEAHATLFHHRGTENTEKN